MSQTVRIPDATVAEAPAETSLAASLSAADASAPELQVHCGARTPLRFSEVSTELQALATGVGVFDLGYRTFLRATGKDRVRWLNGMITQAVKSMAAGQVAYTLVLNAQGRIQGDADVLFSDDYVLLETDRSQAERLLAHLRRFIIMDDVKLEGLDEEMTAIGIAGPRAAETLSKLGIEAPVAGTFQSGEIAGAEVTLVHGYGPVTPRFEIHVPAEKVLTVWQAARDAGAVPCGIAAREDWRVLEGVPQYGVDFSDKHLPQEANLQRALNFTKGCYIGQEIVERIRSRATVHRSLQQFELSGSAPLLSDGERIELRQGGAAVGELTSVAEIELPGLTKTLALGFARREALERSEKNHQPNEQSGEQLVWDGGIATPLAAPPSLQS